MSLLGHNSLLLQKLPPSDPHSRLPPNTSFRTHDPVAVDTSSDDSNPVPPNASTATFQVLPTNPVVTRKATNHRKLLLRTPLKPHHLLLTPSTVFLPGRLNPSWLPF